MIVIGADAHKRTHALAAVEEGTGRVRGSREIEAEDAGHLAAVRWAVELDEERVWAVEDCRRVSGRLEAALIAAGERVVRVPPRMMGASRRAERTPGKSDQIDALAVARAVVRDGVDRFPGAFLDERAMEIRYAQVVNGGIAAFATARLRWLPVGLAALSTFALVGLVSAGAARGQSVTFTFRSTGAEQIFTVPIGVSTLHMAAIGGRGGSEVSVEGGFGAVATADLPVTGGGVLYIEVAGNGGPGDTTGTLGFNGGGTAGLGGGGGGGASDVRTSSVTAPGSLTSRLIVAGGGGGATGLAEGGNAGASGHLGSGGAGTATEGGAGGSANGGFGGGPGMLGIGGPGGFGGAHGAGGGGGLYGGGGGGGGSGLSCSPHGCSFSYGGTGGGGSCGFGPTATDTSVGIDTTGVPSVTISYVVSHAAITNSLDSQLVPSGQGTRISHILNHGGYAAPFNTLAAGKPAISWYQLPKGTHIGAAKALLVAKGNQTFAGPNTSTVTIRLTGKGRKLLKHAKLIKLKRLKLTAKGTFTPANGTSVSTKRTFMLHR